MLGTLLKIFLTIYQASKEYKILRQKNITDIKNFFAFLEKADLMGFSETSNLDEMYNRYRQKLLNTIIKNTPKKTLSNKEMKLQTKPWIDKKHYIKFMKKIIIDRNKKMICRNVFKTKLETQKGHGRKLTKFLITINQVVITYT